MNSETQCSTLLWFTRCYGAFSSHSQEHWVEPLLNNFQSNNFYFPIKKVAQTVLFVIQICVLHLELMASRCTNSTLKNSGGLFFVETKTTNYIYSKIISEVNYNQHDTVLLYPSSIINARAKSFVERSIKVFIISLTTAAQFHRAQKVAQHTTKSCLPE